MKHRHTDIWLLLRQYISKGQLLGYSVSNIIGLAVILAGVLFYCDSHNKADASDSYFSDDYAVLSKRVSGVGFKPVSFSEAEIADIERQPWARKVGRFTASQFAVNGSISMGSRGLSSYMFFESVPDDFFDIKPRDWEFNPSERFVPIIVSKDYLTLYNFGFALPQGLPQVSEDVIGAVPISLRLTGEEGTPETFEAAIVGFSSRLNTIAVPQSFMDWANSHFYEGEMPEPSRLIVKVDRMQASSMKDYLTEHDIEVAGDQDGTEKITGFLSVVSEVVTVNGLVISALALFVLLLSIFLLLQKSRGILRNLMLLGYSPSDVGRYYIRLVGAINLAVTVIALGIAFYGRTLWSARLADISLGNASPLPAVAIAVAYFIIVTAANAIIIRRHLIRIWNDR